MTIVSLRKRVIDIFTNGTMMTTEGIENELNVSNKSNAIKVYLNQYVKSGRLIVVGKDGRYNVYKKPDERNGIYDLNMKNRDLQNKIDSSNKQNEELKNHIKFLMDFFQENKNSLAINARKYSDRFKEIVEVFK